MTPLFLREGLNLCGSKIYGGTLSYRIKIPGSQKKTSTITVTFVELPILKWGKLSNEEKRVNQITKKAGISILRKKREIDYGWLFMGGKRKENYDDWWRCEINFEPELDELFGVTHTKQGIKETDEIKSIIVKDLEQCAYALNNRARLKFIELNTINPQTFSKSLIERNERYLPPIPSRSELTLDRKKFKTKIGYSYRIIVKDLKESSFYSVEIKNDCIIIILNKSHVFYHSIFKKLHLKKITSTSEFIKIIEILIIAAARSELQMNGQKGSTVLRKYKVEWSSNIKSLFS